tara:strand:- start:566 stop:1570 length:1005 start_codon:yes stop_codon:yes gene_type:complete
VANIRHLTGLRAVAALIVFISHSANEGVINPIFGQGFGKIGVMIFFILSGFLMGCLYLNREPGFFDIKYYIVARIARVVPLYFLLLLLSYFIYNFIYTEFYYSISYLELLVSLFMIQAPSVFWTIPVEFQFYVVFILFWLSFFYCGCKFFLPFLIVVTLPILFLYLSGSHLPNILPKYAFSFFLGVGVSIFYEKIIYSDYSIFFDRYGWVFLVLLFVNLPEARSQLGLNFGSSVYVKTWLDPISWTLVFCLFISCVCSSKSLNFLNNPIVQYLGRISYGFYLIHYPVLYVLKGFLMPWWLIFLAAFTVTILLASVSFYYFERPLQKMIMLKYSR